MTTTPVACFPNIVLDVADLSQRLERILLDQSHPSSFAHGDHLVFIHSPAPKPASEDTPMRSRLHTHWKAKVSSLAASEQHSLARNQRPETRGVLGCKASDFGNDTTNSSKKTIGWKNNSPDAPRSNLPAPSATISSRSPSPTDSVPYLSDNTRASSPTLSDPRSDEDDGEYFYPPPLPLRIYSNSPPPALGGKPFTMYDWDPDVEGDTCLPLDSLKMYRRLVAVEKNEMAQGVDVELSSGGVGDGVASPWGWQWDN
ncbi:hypothetical protein AAF712_008111 [Marasmius tenuissimus]|uniref:Uncharacterized protein n=1 Tax=Marasmius tenuissimus TaxID=585030 RepID=A0ABR2ZUM8_9AGAR